MTDTEKKCPRCTGPLAQLPGDLGASSRVTIEGRIKICGDCGRDEAMRDAQGLSPIPPYEWPIERAAQ